MYYAIVVVLAAAIVAAYLAGVKKGKKWGQIVMVVCVLGLVLTVGRRAIFSGRSAAPGTGIEFTAVGQDEERVRALASELKDQIEAGADICVVMKPDHDPKEEEKTAAYREVLTEVLWSDAVGELVVIRAGGGRGVYTPETEDVGAILYLHRWTALGLSTFDPRPKTAAWFAGDPQKARARAQQELASGLLDVAILADGTVLRPE